MDEIAFNSSSSQLSLLPLFFAGRVLLREDGRQHRAPSSIYRRGCMPHHHFHLQLLYILRLGKLTRRGRQKVPMKIAHAHYKPYKTVLFYEASAAHVELTPSKLYSGGVESDRDQDHLIFYKAFMDEVRCPMSYHQPRRAWKLMTILMGIHSQHYNNALRRVSIDGGVCCIIISSSAMADTHLISIVLSYPMSERPRRK